MFHQIKTGVLVFKARPIGLMLNCYTFIATIKLNCNFDHLLEFESK